MTTLIRTYYSLNVPAYSGDAYCQKFVGYFNSVVEAEAKAVELGVEVFLIDEEEDHKGDGEYTVIG